MICNWKPELLSRLPSVVYKHNAAADESQSVDSEKLYAQISQLEVENAFLKKLQEAGDMKGRARKIRPRHAGLSVRRQYELLAVNRGSL